VWYLIKHWDTFTFTFYMLPNFLTLSHVTFQTVCTRKELRIND